MDTYRDLKECAARVRQHGYVAGKMYTDDGNHGCMLGVMALVAGYTHTTTPPWHRVSPRMNAMIKAVAAEVAVSRDALLLKPSGCAATHDPELVALWNDSKRRDTDACVELVAKMFDYAAARVKGATQAAAADIAYTEFRTGLTAYLTAGKPVPDYFEWTPPPAFA